jgi:hypothetical protein
VRLIQTSQGYGLNMLSSARELRNPPTERFSTQSRKNLHGDLLGSPGLRFHGLRADVGGGDHAWMGNQFR